MAAVRGTAWLTLTEFITRQAGPGAVEKVIAGLAPADAAVLSKKILPISWVEYGAYTRFLLQADQMFGQGDYALIRESAVYHARKDMNGIYRMFIRIATPNYVLGKAAQIWRQVMDSGTLTVHQQSPHGVELMLRDFTGVPLHHELDQLPFFEEVARMTGVKNVHCTHPKCLARGDDHGLYALTWE